jgi:ABC-type antimicrobial peptide transport system permease subunit
MGLLIRSSAPPRAVASGLRQTLGEISPELRVFRTQVEQRRVRERLMAWLAGSFGALAALLAMIGLYGVISYMVVRRRNEIGIRMALGADRRRIVQTVVGEAGILLGLGLALGTVLPVVTTRTAEALLFGLRPNDPLTLGLSAAALAVVALAASFLPARRAAALDPMTALRDE